MKKDQVDISHRERFAFGANWRSFLSVLDDDRIAEAGRSLKDMLHVDTLEGKSFLDVGCGSGLFSLAAARLGASKIHTFDLDPQSVACALELKRRYFNESSHWTIELGNILDHDYATQLRDWDIVYSWGVLHHTGHMWAALANMAPFVKLGGLLFIAIYNDQGEMSEHWLKVKTRYNSGFFGKWLVWGRYVPGWFFHRLLVDVAFVRRNPVRGIISDLRHRRNIFQGFLKSFRKPRSPMQRYREYKSSRGMSMSHDWIDWIGGLPFEVAKPNELIQFYHDRGFELRTKVLRSPGSGNNELVFEKVHAYLE